MTIDTSNETTQNPEAKKRLRRSREERLEAERQKTERLAKEYEEQKQKLKTLEATQKKQRAEQDRKTRTRALILLGLLFEELILTGQTEWTDLADELLNLARKKATSGNKKEVNDMKILIPFLEDLIAKGKAAQAKAKQ